ncbi:hypothetical protein T484DRAFT_2532178 [Baffinella frigidus]|nr:hypothetical protein T484DRAFT_2532178 [Cryptophyta sp. CCMP2293]
MQQLAAANVLQQLEVGPIVFFFFFFVFFFFFFGLPSSSSSLAYLLLLLWPTFFFFFFGLPSSSSSAALVATFFFIFLVTVKPRIEWPHQKQHHNLRCLQDVEFRVYDLGFRSP